MESIVSTTNGACGSFEYEGKHYAIFICESSIVEECLRDQIVNKCDEVN